MSETGVPNLDVVLFIWLLSTFIGKDLALRLIHQAWPELPLNGADSGSEEVEV